MNRAGLAILLAFAAMSGARAAPSARRSVLLVDFDTLRADRAGEPSATPRLDEFARGAYRFTNAVSQAPWTLPSTLSLFTSVHPQSHGVVNKFEVFTEDRRALAKLPARLRTLAEAFKSEGWDTGGFTGGAGVGREFGFARGFDVYEDSAPFGGFDQSLPPALEWIKRRSNAPYFAFAHGYDVHGQFRGLTDEARKKAFLELRDKTISGEPISASTAEVRVWAGRYDEQARAADAAFGAFLKEFDADPRNARTVVVVLSDHGEQLYEHGGFDHGTTLYDEVLRVPLLIRIPGRRGGVIPAQVRLIDVMPTLLELAGVAVSTQARAQLEGVSLAPLLDGKPLSLDAYSETDFLLRASKRSLRTSEGWKLILDMQNLSGELFDLRADPGEKTDLSEREPARTLDLTQRLLRHAREARSGPRPENEPSPGVMRDLREKGYW